MKNIPTSQLGEPQVADHNQHVAQGEIVPAASGVEPYLSDREQPDEPVADLQQEDLHACEELIERIRFNGWFEIGKALKTIHDKDLYKQGPYGTFDEYVRRRWNVERTYAHRLIKAAEVYANLLSIDNIKLPTAEGQVRPLARLNPPPCSRRRGRWPSEKQVTPFPPQKMSRHQSGSLRHGGPRPTKRGSRRLLNGAPTKTNRT